MELFITIYFIGFAVAAAIGLLSITPKDDYCDIRQPTCVGAVFLATLFSWFTVLVYLFTIIETFVQKKKQHKPTRKPALPIYKYKDTIGWYTFDECHNRHLFIYNTMHGLSEQRIGHDLENLFISLDNQITWIPYNTYLKEIAL